MQGFVYPITLTGASNEGGYIVSCRDLPEVVTQGESVAEALDEAAGALQAAVEMRIEDRLEIPAPSAPKRREHLVILPVTTAIKAALYLTMREQGITKSDLARLLHLDEKEARRILDPKHGTKVNTMERALHALGKRVEVLVS
jgi:antitoxin HicB